MSGGEDVLAEVDQDTSMLNDDQSPNSSSSSIVLAPKDIEFFYDEEKLTTCYRKCVKVKDGKPTWVVHTWLDFIFKPVRYVVGPKAILDSIGENDGQLYHQMSQIPSGWVFVIHKSGIVDKNVFIPATAFDKEGSMQEAVMAADISGMYGKLGINQLSISAGNHSQVRAFKSFVNQELEKNMASGGSDWRVPVRIGLQPNFRGFPETKVVCLGKDCFLMETDGVWHVARQEEARLYWHSGLNTMFKSLKIEHLEKRPDEPMVWDYLDELLAEDVDDEMNKVTFSKDFVNLTWSHFAYNASFLIQDMIADIAGGHIPVNFLVGHARAGKTLIGNISCCLTGKDTFSQNRNTSITESGIKRLVRETDQTIILDDIKDLKVLGPVFKELANGGITKDGAKEFRMSRPVIVLCNPPEFERLQETCDEALLSRLVIWDLDDVFNLKTSARFSILMKKAQQLDYFYLPLSNIGSQPGFVEQMTALRCKFVAAINAAHKVSPALRAIFDRAADGYGFHLAWHFCVRQVVNDAVKPLEWNELLSNHLLEFFASQWLKVKHYYERRAQALMDDDLKKRKMSTPTVIESMPGEAVDVAKDVLKGVIGGFKLCIAKRTWQQWAPYLKYQFGGPRTVMSLMAAQGVYSIGPLNNAETNPMYLNAVEVLAYCVSSPVGAQKVKVTTFRFYGPQKLSVPQHCAIFPLTVFQNEDICGLRTALALKYPAGKYMEIEKVMMARTKIKLVIPEQYRIPQDDEWYGPLDDGVYEGEIDAELEEAKEVSSKSRSKKQISKDASTSRKRTVSESSEESSQFSAKKWKELESSASKRASELAEEGDKLMKDVVVSCYMAKVDVKYRASILDYAVSVNRGEAMDGSILDAIKSDIGCGEFSHQMKDSIMRCLKGVMLRLEDEEFDEFPVSLDGNSGPSCSKISDLSKKAPANTRLMVGKELGGAHVEKAKKLATPSRNNTMMNIAVKTPNQIMKSNTTSSDVVFPELYEAADDFDEDGSDVAMLPDNNRASDHRTVNIASSVEARTFPSSSPPSVTNEELEASAGLGANVSTADGDGLEDASINVDGLDPLKRGIKYCAKLGCSGSIKGVTVTMHCLECNLKYCFEHIGKDSTWRETIKKLYGPRNEAKRREIGFTCTDCVEKKNDNGG